MLQQPEKLDHGPLPNCPIWDVALSERDVHLLTELRWASAIPLPRCVVSPHATAWAESLEGGMSGHQSWALLCRYRCRLVLAEIPKGVDRNSELKQRLHLWEMEQGSDWQGLGSGEFWATPWNSREDAADRQRGKRACALTVRGSISNVGTYLLRQKTATATATATVTHVKTLGCH